MKKYDYEYREITPDCVEEVLEMQLEWYRWQEENNSSPALVAENEAIAKVLKEMDTIKNLTGGTPAHRQPHHSLYHCRTAWRRHNRYPF